MFVMCPSDRHGTSHSLKSRRAASRLSKTVLRKYLLRIMALAWTCLISLWIFAALKGSDGAAMPNLRRNYSGAEAEVFKICAMICSRSPSNENLTFVFVLHVDPKFSISLDYLWKFPRALIHLSDDDIVLGDKEREIVISWERDPGPGSYHKSTYWNLRGSCGYRSKECEAQEGFYKTQFLLEKRVLVQIREWSLRDAPRNPLTFIQGFVPIDLRSFFKRYRATFIIVRMERGDRLHSRITVRRTGRIIGKQVLQLAAEEFHPDHVRSVFASPRSFINGSEDLYLSFQYATFLGADKWTGFFFGSCVEVSYSR